MPSALAAVLATLAIFLPGALLLVAALPFWQWLMNKPSLRTVSQGVNAAVVGILLAAFFDPLYASTITSTSDIALTLLAFLLLQYWRIAPYWVLLLCLLVSTAINP
jgi:chromate transporter